MGAFLVTSISGFFAAYLVLYTAALPYLLRRARPAGGRGGMTLHYCIGYLIFGVLMLHMLVSMQAGMARGADLTGLNLATAALFLVMLQVMLGTTLMAGGPKAGSLRRVHWVLMLGIVALSALHLALNSALLQGLMGWSLARSAPARRFPLGGGDGLGQEADAGADRLRGLARVTEA